MELSAVLTAGTASVTPDGLLQLAGGGWEFVRAPQFPETISGYVAGVAEFGPDEIGSLPTISLRVAAEGHVDGSLGSITVNANRHRSAFAIPFTLVVIEPDIVTATLSAGNGSVLRSISFPVRHDPSPAGESE